ncbi:MAG TPA: hypothetical protein VGC85_08840 [Chthoniobacterales bacterium]
MITKLATCLLACSLLAACETSTTSRTTTTTTAARHQKLSDRMLAQNQVNPNVVGEPAPPAEGPEDVPANGTVDPNRNPALLPTPLLRTSAASGL